MTVIITLIVINAVVVYVYTFSLKKCAQIDILTVVLISTAMPFFGVIIIYFGVTLVNKYSSNITNFEGHPDSVIDDINIFDDSSIDPINVMPISNALTLKNIKQKRKLLFYSFKGNTLSLYPFLQKSLKDTDAEIVHYASSIITDYRRQIYEVFEKTRMMFASNPDSIIICKEYTDAFYNLICWEELNGEDENYERKDFEIVLKSFFTLNKYIEKNYYIRKIRNEIAMEEFDAAYKTCMDFTNAYPEYYMSYVIQLELHYYNKDLSHFKDILSYIRYKEIVLSCETERIVSFWESKLKINRGIK